MTALAIKNPTPVEQGYADAFATLDGADPARVDAWENFASQGLPHRRVEAWKYSDLRAALKEADAPLALNAIGFSPPPRDRVLLDRAPADAMPALAASMAGAADVYVLEGQAEPVSIEIGVPAESAHHRVIDITLAPGAKALVQESYLVEDGAFANVAVRYWLGEGAVLERIVRQESGGDGVAVVTADMILEAGAELRQTTLALGARLARLETRLDHRGPGAKARMDAAYLLNGSRHADITTAVNHSAPDCETTQTVRGAVDDRGKGVFQGRYRVERHAQKTDARMHHAALLLDDGASANAKPELLIYADDVQCAHGNTVGALDEEALFYMRSRGLPEADARALLIEAFIAEALSGVSEESIREGLTRAAQVWLEGGR